MITGEYDSSSSDAACINLTGFSPELSGKTVIVKTNDGRLFGDDSSVKTKSFEVSLRPTGNGYDLEHNRLNGEQYRIILNKTIPPAGTYNLKIEYEGSSESYTIKVLDF